ncbi:MAG: peptidylprolyl isomerase [Lachnospiraceae bacterium]|nr:peptidylprolyl isomerase [Lachnospiraceae bacterium]
MVVACIVFVIYNRQKDNGSSEQQKAGQESDKDASSGSGGTQADTGGKCYADIDIKDYGKITVELDEKSAPITVKNFVSLAKDGFYNGLTFHRIIEGFMMQGGDPQGTGLGGSGKTIIGEFANNGYDNKLSHTRGAISMARSNSNNSASSQFFIVHQDSLFLDGDYAVFGYVTEGIEVVDAVCQAAQPVDDNGTIPPEAQPVITSITIRS